MQALVDEAQALEADGVVPYQVLDEGYFCSTQLYPRVSVTFERVRENGYFYIFNHGDTLLEINVSDGECYASLGGGSCIFHSSNGKITFFEGGLPFTEQIGGFWVYGVKPGAILTGVFEVYGREYSAKMGKFNLPEDEGRGFNLRSADQTYWIVGRDDFGYSHNTVVEAPPPKRS